MYIRPWQAEGSSMKGQSGRWAHSKGRLGSALVVTLLIVATLTGLTLAFSEESGTELSLAGFAGDGYRAYQIARSGINFALGRLEQDEDKGMDSLREEWSLLGVHGFPENSPGEFSISGGVIDENGKINVNSLINEKGEVDEQIAGQLGRLFKVLGLDENLVNPILDWLDPDDEERLHGAETFYYRSLEDPYECANTYFLSVGQIFLLKGFRGLQRFGEEGQKRLLDYLTIYSDGKININTASGEVLQSLHSDIDPPLAQSIIDYQNQEDFLSIDDLKKVPGIDDQRFNEIKGRLTVKSSAFSIEARVESREAVAGINAFAVRKEEKPVLVYWRVI